MNQTNLINAKEHLKQANILLNKELSESLKPDYKKVILSKLCYLINDLNILIDEVNNPEKNQKLREVFNGK